jgi:uncharacterized protein YcnI
VIRKLRNLIVSLTTIGLLLPSVAMAHAVVTPAEVGIGQTQIFTLSVPNENNSPITQVKLLLPAGLDEVSPLVKADWHIQASKDSITWSGGSVPIGLTDAFSFRAQAPAEATQLNWKTYQTYADGTVVSWDQPPTKNEEGANGPYSVTKVADDLTATSPKTDNLPLILAIVALVFSLIAIQRSRQQSRK